MRCLILYVVLDFFFFFKQKTAYEIVSRDWSSDVCSSDLTARSLQDDQAIRILADAQHEALSLAQHEIGVAHFFVVDAHPAAENDPLRLGARPAFAEVAQQLIEADRLGGDRHARLGGVRPAFLL